MEPIHKSKVAVILKNNVLESPEFSRESLLFLASKHTYFDHHESGLMYVIDSIVWETFIEPIGKLYEELEKFDEEDYLILEVCFAAPEINYNDRGEWHDNPWNVRKQVALVWGAVNESV